MLPLSHGNQRPDMLPGSAAASPSHDRSQHPPPRNRHPRTGFLADPQNPTQAIAFAVAFQQHGLRFDTLCGRLV